jgi:hypothetical protein
MRENALIRPVELTDAELDQVSAGILNGGLINADVIVNANNIANNNNVQVAVNVLGNLLQTA